MCVHNNIMIVCVCVHLYVVLHKSIIHRHGYLCVYAAVQTVANALQLAII